MTGDSRIEGPDQPSPVHASNIVWDKISETAKNDPSVNSLRNSVDEIANKFLAERAFDKDNQSQWQLPDWKWDDWLRNDGPSEHAQ